MIKPADGFLRFGMLAFIPCVFQLMTREKDEVVTICDRLKRLKFSPVLSNAFTEHGFEIREVSLIFLQGAREA